MNFRFALCLMALCGLLSFPAQAQSVATLMRVTIDGRPASREAGGRDGPRQGRFARQSPAGR